MTLSRKISRREWFRTVVALVAGSSGVSTLASAEHVASIPEHVSIEFDEAFLQTYQPRYVMSSDAEDLHRATYAWVVRSPEYDTDVCCYFNAFVGQSGVTSYDSHRGDHEPAYCWVNSESGDLEAASASIYHWLEGYADAATVPTADSTHPVLKVIDPWHHHTAGQPGTGDVTDLQPLGTRAGLEDPETTTEFEAWLANGLEDSLGVNTVTEPWTMRDPDRSHWWRRDLGPFSTTALEVKAAKLVGWGVAGSLSG